jgi:putative ABC transport system substrate-binding protein
VRDAGEIERIVDAFAREPRGGLIPIPGPLLVTHRDLVISLATRNRLQNVYAYRYYPASGGLASYGVDNIESYRRAASYVDRILKGEKPAELPVQMPTKYELVVNLKTAKALVLTIPETLLATADERQLMGSDATLDNAHVAEDYLARTTTMYRIIAVGRTCSVP